MSEFHLTMITGDADAPSEMSIGTDRGTSLGFQGFENANDGARGAFSLPVDGPPTDFVVSDVDQTDFFSLYRACVIARDPLPAPLAADIETRFCADLQPADARFPAPGPARTVELSANVPVTIPVRVDVEDVVELGYDAVLSVPVGTQQRSIDVTVLGQLIGVALDGRGVPEDVNFEAPLLGADESYNLLPGVLQVEIAADFNTTLKEFCLNVRPSP